MTLLLDFLENLANNNNNNNNNNDKQSKTRKKRNGSNDSDEECSEHDEDNGGACEDPELLLFSQDFGKETVHFISPEMKFFSIIPSKHKTSL